MTLIESLSYKPQELQFGTSGRRGLVVDLTQLEIYINALAELEYLQAQGGIKQGDEFYFARDLRPSSLGIAEAIVAALRDAGMKPVNLGLLPTPALTYYALQRRRGSMMITGSHIPFDRNGYKTNSSAGELTKEDEAPINAQVARVRAKLYAEEASSFDANGTLKQPVELPEETAGAREEWIARYTSFFTGKPLAGKRVLVYQHSAVGRDLLVDLLRELGAEVIAKGRSETFVPIDTENIGAPELAAIHSLLEPNLDAVVSLDGDSDRPLVLDGNGHFYGGDLLGMVVSGFLHADAVVVPITCNDAVDRGALKDVLEPKTRIGSPFVIKGIAAAREKGRQRICGWEPNGGFLLGSDIGSLKALPTRDAFLPIVAVLAAGNLTELFGRLPKRFSKAALLKNFPRATSLKIIAGLNKELLEQFFGMPVDRIDRTDGVRALFKNGEVAHVRPSGNADELRIYAVADSQARADEIADPEGVLRKMEKYFA